MKTPVHVFTSGDEAELFLNGRSQGRKKTGSHEYRLRWDDIRYEPGELKAVAYKNGAPWAEEIIRTTGDPASLTAKADRSVIHASGEDLSFVTVQVTDKELQVVPVADNPILFTLEGPGEIIATDNGNPADFIPFHSTERNAFNGLALVIVRSRKDQPGDIMLHVSSPGLEDTSIRIQSK